MPWGLMLRCSQSFSQLCSGVVSGLQRTEGMHLVNSYLEVITECREPAPPGLHREEEHCQQLSGVGPSLLSMVRLPGVQGWCWAPQNSSGESSSIIVVTSKGSQQWWRSIFHLQILEHLSCEEKQTELDPWAWRREGSGESYPCVLIRME